MTGLSAADELAMVRAHVAQLRKREVALKAQLMDVAEAERDGRWHRVECEERTVRVFDHRLLPPQWRDDPMFWREKTITQLRCIPLRARRPVPMAAKSVSPVPNVIEGRAVRL